MINVLMGAILFNLLIAGINYYQKSYAMMTIWLVAASWVIIGLMLTV